MNTEDINKPGEIVEDVVEREIDEPLLVDEEEAVETEQIKAELKRKEREPN